MKRNIGFDAMKITISQIVTLSVSMITAMILSRYLSLQDYGTYSQMILIITLVSTLFGIGLPSSINYFAARTENNKEKQEFFSNYYTLSTLLGILAGIFVLLCAPFIVKYFNNTFLLKFVYILVVLPWAKIIDSSISNFLIIYNKTNKLLIYQFFHSILLMATILVAMLYDLGFQLYMSLYLLVEVAFLAIIYIIVFKTSEKIYIRMNLKLIKEILVFSIPIGLATAVGTISIQIDKMIVGRVYSVEQLAVFSISSKELPITFIAGSITAVLLPHIVKKIEQKKMNEAVGIWKEASILSYIIICFFVAFIFVFSSEIITLLYSEKYLEGISIFRIFTLVLLIRFTYFAMILNATGYTKFIFYSSLLSLVINLLMNLVLYRIFGFIGPALATLFSMGIIALVQLIVTAKVIKIPFRTVMPWKKMFQVSLINIVGGLIFFFVRNYTLRFDINIYLKLLFFFLVWSSIYFIFVKNEIKESWKALN
ncbi:oligosaccharide flippase family protein [Paenibacillus sp. FSL R7-0331]|uniref:oligosaccharide flippase family protein n=1 Tax=Paenibacillus sp. FSL R7-0331 TaxID=1536773 RepID=UPI0004F5B34C|nr:oligosaccharide flippase family protein [Paenibacillus sp. FSL R7-0331]AIQ54433.1 hypothetical protein R70331_24865 [Paenibacillus sp. FSL R7-0331]